MRKTGYKLITYIMIITFLTNFFVIGLAGSIRVEAGFWDEHKGGLMTVIKGIVMLYIMNLISQKTSGGNEGLITSTIRKGLNLEDSTETEDDSSNTNTTSIDNNSGVNDNGDSIDENSKTNEQTSNQTEIEITTEKSVSVIEQELVDLVNKARREQGLQPLKVDKDLREIARIKAEDMIKNDYFKHQSPNYGSPFDMMKQKSIKYSLAGENLAEARTVEKAFQDLMNSPEHKKNILEAKYDKIGVGIVKGGTYGLMIVQEFIDSPVITE